MSLQEQLNAVIEQLGNDMDNDTRAALEQKKAVLTMQIEDSKAQEAVQQERIQAQVEKVESITLPYDFNEVFGDPRANDIVIELIKDLQRQAYDEHNVELNEIVTAHREELRAAADREQQLKVKIDLLETKWEVQEDELNDLQSALNHMRIERDDALSKRDAAVRDKEGIELLISEKQSQIDTLRDEIAIGAKAAVNVIHISGNDRLAVLVEQSKNAKVKSAIDIALETPVPFRGKVISDGQVVANLDAPQVTPFPIIDQTGNPISGVDATQPAIVPADDQVTFPEEAVSTLSTGLAEGVSSEVGESGKTLEERVKALELHVFGQ